MAAERICGAFNHLPLQRRRISWILSRVKIQRALLSVSDKTGLVPFAQTLAAGGSGNHFHRRHGQGPARGGRLTVTDMSAHTGFPEMLDGRVKTLHPKVHGGLLYIRGNATHEAAVQAHGIEPIDLVVVNLYPFEQTVARPDVTPAGGHREHRHRRAVHAAQRGQEPRQRHGGGGPGRLRDGRRTDLRNRQHDAGTAPQARSEGFRAHRGLRRAIAAHLQKEFGNGSQPADCTHDACALSIRAAGPTAALRRKSAPEGGALRRFPRLFPATARQGAFLQQHPGPDRGREP